VTRHVGHLLYFPSSSRTRRFGWGYNILSNDRVSFYYGKVAGPQVPGSKRGRGPDIMRVLYILIDKIPRQRPTMRAVLQFNLGAVAFPAPGWDGD
jgi:hypothetical protein